ncbi:unnamed protein product [Rotaria magnacalcarata]|uniref:UMOD/GP2/OIT3-like D8C domain-containing protein n=1 Tax=Rotaria magnacalcarata TaxID=392030 RepID=A0A815UV85_9BILA|nr:unnamed protein product [Rotaria magnacalcarata]CAF4370672.1 unnamed protein product [Rotaria magnacalcarata]
MDQHRQIQVKISIIDVSSRQHALFVADVSSVSQCSNYTLDTDASRLATYSATTSSCDSTVFSTALWVRFTGGGATRLATSATLSNRCGTYYTGWLVSPLPSTSGTTVSSVVCFSWSTNICNWVTTISVTNCNAFYVFQLPSPPVGCNSRYCTE